LIVGGADATDTVGLTLHHEPVELIERKRCEQLDPGIEASERIAKGCLALRLGALDCCRVRNAPQCAVIGWPGHGGQTSLAALSQTVITKSITGESWSANPSQLLERRPSVGSFIERNRSSTLG
jgi:hypothetical protein